MLTHLSYRNKILVVFYEIIRLTPRVANESTIVLLDNQVNNLCFYNKNMEFLVDLSLQRSLIDTNPTDLKMRFIALFSQNDRKVQVGTRSSRKYLQICKLVRSYCSITFQLLTSLQKDVDPVLYISLGPPRACLNICSPTIYRQSCSWNFIRT